MNIFVEIKKDPMVWKFSFYGLLKNLKFFEPYLILYLISFDLTLFQIGVLYSIREIITYVFEVPSGIIADHYGKKNELMICFVFYIASFILFFIGGSFTVFIGAMSLFGLGEAFRSGTHKAIILSYLEHKGWFEHKSFVYGRTRSYSLFGSSISSFASVLIILSLPATRWIFLITTLPYVIDFLMIATYPDYLNERIESDRSMRKFLKLSFESIKSIFSQRYMMKITLNSATYDGLFKTVKDYIQPIVVLLLALESDERIKVTLGIIYGVFYIFSSLASRNVYRLNKRWTSSSLLTDSYRTFAALMLVIGVSILFDSLVVTIAVFFIAYIMKDVRRPLFVDLVSDYMEKKQRATVLSVESQIRSLLIVVIAPVFGLISDTLGIAVAFIIFSFSAFLFSAVFNLKRKPIN